jgi:hypothetical protein
MTSTTISNGLLTEYNGSSISIDGVKYVWNGTTYEPTNQLDPDTESKLGYRKKVVLQFSLYIEPSTPLRPDEVEVLIDGIKVTDPTILQKGSSLITITLSEAYLLTRRIITFECNRAAAMFKYIVQARVTSSNDVVVEQYPIDDTILNDVDLVESPVINDDTTVVVQPDETGRIRDRLR